MKPYLLLLLFPLLFISTDNPQQQQCVTIDSVYVTAKMKQLSTRDIRFGVKQTAEEILSEKYCLNDDGEKIQIEISYIGMPTTSFRVGGVGSQTQTTEVKVILHFMGSDYEGEGESNTDVKTVMIELKDDKIPFSKMTISNSLKQAIQDAITKMP
jgi:hypothetical protein